MKTAFNRGQNKKIMIILMSVVTERLLNRQKLAQLTLKVPITMEKVNKQCLLDTPRTVRVGEKTWQVIVQTSRPYF